MIQKSRKEFFNEMAPKWDEKYLTDELKSFLDEFVSRFGIETKQNVLDLGTGTGVLIPFLLKQIGSSGSITAIDYAENMVEICTKKFSHISNLTIMNQDVEALDLSPNSFDAITCFGLFPHIENREKALNNMNRVLKHGGRLIIAHALGSQEINNRHRKASSSVINDNLPEESDMKKLLTKSGFGEITIEDSPGQYLCTSTKINNSY